MLRPYHGQLGCLSMCRGQFGVGKKAGSGLAHCANQWCRASPNLRRLFHLHCIEKHEGREQSKGSRPQGGVVLLELWTPEDATRSGGAAEVQEEAEEVEEEGGGVG